MDSKHFADAGVVVPDLVLRVALGIEIAHSGFRTPNKSAVAEYDPGFFRGSEKWVPEHAKRSRGLLRFRGKRRLHGSSPTQEFHVHNQDNNQQNREQSDCYQPLAGSIL